MGTCPACATELCQNGFEVWCAACGFRLDLAPTLSGATWVSESDPEAAAVLTEILTEETP